MELLTLYARKHFHSDGRAFDVIVSRDRDQRDRVAMYRAGMSNRPDRRFKTIVHNCYRWALEWLPDAGAPAGKGRAR